MTAIATLSKPKRIEGPSSGVYALRNPLTGNWLCFGQNTRSTPYLMPNAAGARSMLKTISHFNLTGEIRSFK